MNTNPIEKENEALSTYRGKASNAKVFRRRRDFDDFIWMLISISFFLSAENMKHFRLQSQNGDCFILP